MFGFRRLLAAGCATVAAVAPVVISPAPASAAGAVPNPSFEHGWYAGKLRCWNTDPADLARFTVTRKGYDGKAAYVAGHGRPDQTITLATDRTDACRITVSPGQRYGLKLWQRSTAGLRPVLFTYAAATGWTRAFTGAPLPAARPGHYAVTFPPVPIGVIAVSVGVMAPASSTVVVDDVSLTPAPGGVLFTAPFTGGNRLITNEFAYWSPGNATRVESPLWEMTSGSLFARDGNGYTGQINNLAADALSRLGTNSAVFRLNTRDRSFGDVGVALSLKVSAVTSTPTTPPVSWDGVHIFLRHQSQYELYYASVARRDGRIVIKKKCQGGPTNGGSYYELSDEVRGYPIPLGSWLRVGTSVRNNTDGSVTIKVFRNGRLVVAATDRGTGCAPIRRPGATGIRGDNAEFQFNGFTVAALS